ncbi:hypothetical protein PspR76_03115 [Pseudomonas sp. R76]|nr:hypothetical protein PspR76_03115 [Pseudomonas sp. R76]
MGSLPALRESSESSEECEHRQCGSGLARESGRSVNDVLNDPPLSRASPLPQGIRVISFL